MLAWLFERKIFSPTNYDPSSFFMKKKKKKKTTFILKGIPVEKLAMQNFIFTASRKYVYLYYISDSGRQTNLT